MICGPLDPGQLVELGPADGPRPRRSGPRRGHRRGGPGGSCAAAGAGASARPAAGSRRRGFVPAVAPESLPGTEPLGVVARRVRHGPPRRRRPGRPTTRVGGSGGVDRLRRAAIRSARSPCARRSAGRRFAHGRTTARSGSPARSASGHAGREGRQQRVLVFLGRLGRRPPDPHAVERAKRLEPVGAGVRPPIAELGPGDRRDPSADRLRRSRRRTARSATAARTTPSRAASAFRRRSLAVEPQRLDALDPLADAGQLDGRGRERCRRAR